MHNIVTLKDLREHVAEYAKKVQRGESFIIMKRAKPLFRIVPLNEGQWEEVIDFTKIVRGGVRVEELLSRL